MIDISTMPLDKKVGQLFFIGIAGPEFDQPTRELLSEIKPGGVCLFARNIREAGQTRKLLDDLREACAIIPFLSIDQEGGLVDRLRRLMTPMPAANKLATPEDAKQLATIIAETLLTLGFNMDFAPVVDVIDDERAKSTNGLFSREFGRSADEVVSLAGTFLATLQDSGIVGCLKHFPGIGAASVDSHEELPQVEISNEEFENIDLYPYKKLLDKSEAVMVAHAAFPRLALQERDQNGKLLPSSLSANFISTLLRQQLGFGGLVITDDLEMGAIVKNYGTGETCKLAINAGVDMLAICADPAAIREGYSAVLEAVSNGDISENTIDASLKRIFAVKELLSAPSAFSPERIAALSEDVSSLNAALS